MEKYKIVADSSCDLPDVYREKYDIDIVPFAVTFDQVKYYKERVDLRLDEFYDLMMKKNYPKTSLPSIADYADVFEKYAKDGVDVLCVCLTSKFSGSYQSAVNAAAMVSEDHPGWTIEVVDSLQGDGGQGLMVYQAALMREEGYTLKDNAAKLNEIRHFGEVIFSVSSLDFLVHGGRLGKASSLLGTILNIKPIIAIKTGELMPYAKIRGNKKVLREMVNIAMNNVGDKKDDYLFCVEDTTRPEDAKILEDMLKELNVDLILPHFPIGVCISAHSGPYNVGISYLKKYNA